MPSALDDVAAERRRSTLAAAVAACIDDESLTDLETLKRAWFFSETGRDEPVGSRPWEELRVLVREHNRASITPVKPDALTKLPEIPGDAEAYGGTLPDDTRRMLNWLVASEPGTKATLHRDEAEWILSRIGMTDAERRAKAEAEIDDLVYAITGEHPTDEGSQRRHQRIILDDSDFDYLSDGK